MLNYLTENEEIQKHLETSYKYYKIKELEIQLMSVKGDVFNKKIYDTFIDLPILKKGYFPVKMAVEYLIEKNCTKKQLYVAKNLVVKIIKLDVESLNTTSS